MYYPIIKKCEYCGNEWDARGGQKGVSRAKAKRFCSRKCAAQHRSKMVYGKNHHCWKGGQITFGEEYLYTKIYVGTPRKYKKIYIHREVMEKHLGRKLEKWEQVHHIDGNKHNNTINNLEVMSKSEHGRLHSNRRWGNV